MDFYVGITDENWFQFLASHDFDEVNFWRPRDQSRFRAIPTGAPFLFKLKKPKDVIVGVAYFAAFRKLPVPMAWDAFGIENGAPSYEAFVRSLGRLSKEAPTSVLDREIGCIILTEPTFFNEPDWIDTPADWPSNIMQGMVYSTSDVFGATLWDEVRARLHNDEPQAVMDLAVRELQSPYGPTDGVPILAKRRLGQGLFRVMTLENYGGRCCVTGESTAPVIEAAHIRPISLGGEHRLDNGLALRADMHILYDRGLISVDPDYRIRVSPRIRDLYHNGVVYYRHDLEQLRSLPNDPATCPNREMLDWHFREVFAA